MPSSLPGWRRAVGLSIDVSPAGMVCVSANDPPGPRNLVVTGRSLQAAFESFVEFARACATLGKPFEVLEGVKLKINAEEEAGQTPPQT